MLYKSVEKEKENFPVFKLSFLFLIMLLTIIYQFYCIQNISEELKTTRIVIIDKIEHKEATLK